MKSLVIGGGGFIGSHLCKALLKAGNQVICIDNFSIGTKSNIQEIKQNNDFMLYEADASIKKSLDDIFKKERPEYVFHLAANSDIQASASNPDIEYKNTYTTTFQTLSCMRKYNVKKLFFASTSAVYGDKRGILLDETTPELSPISYYGAAKLGSEALISAFSYMNDIEALIFRFPNVIGPKLTHGVIYDFYQKLQKNQKQLQILGDGKQSKPYIYVTDLINAIMMFKEKRKKGIAIYNVGVEGETSVTQIADIICKEMELSDVEYVYTGGESGWKGDVPRFQYCIEKIHKAGWMASYSSDEAVKKTVRDIVS